MGYVNLCLLQDRQTIIRLADVNVSNNTVKVVSPSLAKEDDAFSFKLAEESSLPVGSINIWNINYYNEPQNRSNEGIAVVQARLNTNLCWIEIIDAVGIKKTQIREFVNQHFKLQDAHDYLIRFQVDSSYSECLYLKAQQIKQNQISEFVYALPSIKIHNNSIKELVLPILKEKIMIFSSLEVNNPSVYKPIYPPNKMIAELILKNVNSFFHNPGRELRKLIRSTLESMPDVSLCDKIKEIYACDDLDATYYFEEFKKDTFDFLEGTTWSDQFFRRLADVNPDIQERLKQTVQNEWEQENASLKREILNNELLRNNLSKQLSELQTNIKEKQQVLTETVSLLNNKQEELDSFSEKLKSRIDESRKDVASFLSEYTFLSSIIGTQTGRLQMPAVRISGGTQISKESVRQKDDDELLEVVEKNLNAIGFTQWKEELARYVLGAYKARIPLIIAGPLCVDFLNAFSAAFTNRSAHIVEAAEHSELSQFPCLDEKGVVGLFNVIGTSLFGPFCRRAGSRAAYACLLADTTEELAIEPRGIYNYALPLFTEFFVEETTENAELTGSLFDIVQILSVETPDNCAFPQYVVSPLAYQNCQRLHCYATKGLEDDKQSRLFGYLAQTLPLMLSLHYHDELLEQIKDDNKLKDKDRIMLRQLCGAPDE